MQFPCTNEQAQRLVQQRGAGVNPNLLSRFHLLLAREAGNNHLHLTSVFYSTVHSWSAVFGPVLSCARALSVLVLALLLFLSRSLALALALALSTHLPYLFPPQRRSFLAVLAVQRRPSFIDNSNFPAGRSWHAPVRQEPKPDRLHSFNPFEQQRRGIANWATPARARSGRRHIDFQQQQ